MRVLPVVLALACQPQDPGQLPPPPTLTLGGPSVLQPGSTVQFILEGSPGGTAGLAVSPRDQGRLACPAPLATCLDLFEPITLLGTAPVDATGTATFDITLPGSIPVDHAFLQGVTLRGGQVEVSEVHEVTIADEPSGDHVFYLGGAGEQWVRDVHRLSDGTILLAGGMTDDSWVPAGTPTTPMMLPSQVRSSSTGNQAFLLHLSEDLSTPLQLLTFPPDTLRDVARIRTTNLPGEATGEVYISVTRDMPTWDDDGYGIFRLDGNFVDAPPTAIDMAVEVIAEPRRASGRVGESAYKELQPWDVTATGEVYFGRGSEYDFDWAALEKLDRQGQRMVVPGFPFHAIVGGGEHHGPASTFTGGDLAYSAIVLKAGRRGSLRSLDQADHDRLQSDGNGRLDRPGAFPDDYFFSGPCTPASCPGGPGYTGYRTSDKPTQRLGGVVVDRRSGALYIGYSTQSVLPGGNPDFEPAVAAFDADGTLSWFNRLYRETPSNSSPDQYVDGLALDDTHDRLVVLARAHGNNVDNLWKGHEIAAAPSASGFQNQFTGSNGNIHISWLGSFDLVGELQASTWVAELTDTPSGVTGYLTDPNLDGWHDPNQGWPDLNTTRCHGGVDVDARGRVYVSCTGRRTITTADAWQSMVQPADGASKWNSFVRAYSPNLDQVVYSSLLTGPWDPSTTNGVDDTNLFGLYPTDAGVLVVGEHTATNGVADGAPVQTEGVPAWGAAVPDNRTGLVGWLRVP